MVHAELPEPHPPRPAGIPFGWRSHSLRSSGRPGVHAGIPWALSHLGPRYGWADGEPAGWNLLGYVPVAVGAMVFGFSQYRNLPEQVPVDWSPAFLMTGGPYAISRHPMLMGDLLKNMRSSQIFSVCGLPEVQVHKVKANGRKATEPQRFQVELLGLDVFDSITMESSSRGGNDVPCWLLDVDYNGLCFHVSQAFFPRTGAWDNLKRALRGQFDDTVWDHLAGTTSAPFEAGEHGQIAVKVIDDRGNELVVVKPLNGARR